MPRGDVSEFLGDLPEIRSNEDSALQLGAQISQTLTIYLWRQ